MCILFILQNEWVFILFYKSFKSFYDYIYLCFLILEDMDRQLYQISEASSSQIQS